MEGINKIVV